jgi:hypothetical protein
MDPSTPSRPLAASRLNLLGLADVMTTRVIVVGLLAAGVMVACLAATQLIDYGVFNLRFRRLDSDYHLSVFGVVSLLAQVMVAAASIWRGRRVERHRWAWFALGALVGGLVFLRGLTAFNQTTLAAPLACVFGLLCWLTWRDPAGARATVWGALVLMATSLLLHKVGLAADSSHASDYTWSYQLLTVVKHGCELAGWMLLATGIVAGVERRRAPVLAATPRVARDMESIAG